MFDLNIFANKILREFFDDRRSPFKMGKQERKYNLHV